MQTWMSGGAAGATALVLVTLLSACGDRDSGDRASGAGDASVPSDTVAMAADSVAQTGQDLTDANIVALLDHANAADSSAGALAVTKATNPKVKQFAKRMMSEHHALRKQGQDLATKLGVTPEPPADDPVTAMASAETEALKAAPKGPEFDRIYIQQEIAAHEAVLDLAGKGHDGADNAELKALIEKAGPVIEKHLKQAQDIEKSLSTGS